MVFGPVSTAFRSDSAPGCTGRCRSSTQRLELPAQCGGAWTLSITTKVGLSAGLARPTDQKRHHMLTADAVVVDFKSAAVCLRDQARPAHSPVCARHWRLRCAAARRPAALDVGRQLKPDSSRYSRRILPWRACIFILLSIASKTQLISFLREMRLNDRAFQTSAQAIQAEAEAHQERSRT